MTRFTEIAQELELTGMGDLPYTPTEADEIVMLEAVMSEIAAIRKQLDRICADVRERYVVLKAQ